MKEMHPWTCCGSGDSGRPEAVVQEASVKESQEELLQCLTKLTRLQLNDQGTPPDFRLKLQLLECSVQQQRLLQHLIDKQRCTADNLEILHSQATQYYHVVEDQLRNVHHLVEHVSSKLDRPFVATYTNGQRARGSGHRSPKNIRKEADLPSPLETVKEEADLDLDALKPMRVSEGSNESGSPSSSRNQNDFGSSFTLNKALTKLQIEEEIREEERRHKFGYFSELPHEHALQKIVTSTAFDIVCAVVIVCNAAIIGLSTDDGISHALRNIGASERAAATWLRQLGYLCTAFFILELAMKLFVFRFHFFVKKDWMWNLFDFLLVVVGIYDLIIESAQSTRGNDNGGGGDVNITWIRLLRLLRMLKMLRIVRVMRFFRVLRMMMSSIIGSMMTLLWSIFMLSLIMYIFGLCFLQIITGHLADTAEDSLDKQTLRATEEYWNSVPQAMVTLYFAVTGGADWEVLAAPIREAGEHYFVMFMFYIAFTAWAVLNVLTGLYVDTATKVSEMDSEAVGSELHIGVRTRAFKEFMLKQEHPSSTSHMRPCITWSKLEQSMEALEVTSFLALADISDKEECKRAFDRIDIESVGKVELDAFVNGILEHVVPAMKLELMSVVEETRRCSDHQVELFESCRDRFDEVLRRLEPFSGGLKLKCQPTAPSLVY